MTHPEQQDEGREDIRPLLIPRSEYQQKLLREAMETFCWTRDEFAAAYKVARRALDAWLLPASSKGFRGCPNKLLDRIDRDLNAHGDYGIEVITQTPVGDGYDVVCRSGDHQIMFPRLFLHTSISTPPDSGGQSRSHSKRTEVWVSISKQESEGAPTTTARHTTQLLRVPQRLNRQPFWVFVCHHSTAEELRGFYSAGSIALMVQQGGTLDYARINGEYFSALSLPAPHFYRKPLFIFEAQLHASDSPMDKWTRYVTEDGEILQAPPFKVNN